MISISRNVLIISASIGSGHTQAALAIREELLCTYPLTNVTVVDFLDQESALGTFIKESYLKMIGAFPNAYELLYRWTQESASGANVKNIIALVMKRRLQQLLKRYRPDLLVFTHPFPCCAAAHLKRTRQLNLPLAAVMTDFAAHQLWIYKEMDLYFVANAEVEQSLYDEGIDKHRIFITGIPIAANFKNLVKSKAMPLPTILIMGGGLGLGSVEKAVLRLQSAKSKFNITVVSGKNEVLRERLTDLQTLSDHPLTVIGYTNQINELMGAASLLITKPGALTCSEALAMRLPMLLLDPLPGQEEDNAEYLIRQHAAVRIPNVMILSRLVDALVANRETLDYMQSIAGRLSRPDAARSVALQLMQSFNMNKTAVHAG